MANFCPAKSANEWRARDLRLFNVFVVEQGLQTFFNGLLPEYTGPPAFIQHEEIIDALDIATASLFKLLRLATEKEDVWPGDDTDVIDFVARIMYVLDYTLDEPTVVLPVKTLQLRMCGEVISGRTDVCVIDCHSRDIWLLVLEDKTRDIHLADLEARLVAQAIAVFQMKNTTRVEKRSLPPLQSDFVPGITMVGTFPRFYKIEVTAELDSCLQQGRLPDVRTTVYRHTPRVPRSWNDGMEPLDNRLYIMRCFEAFRQFVSH